MKKFSKKKNRPGTKYIAPENTHYKQHTAVTAESNRQSDISLRNNRSKRCKTKISRSSWQSLPADTFQDVNQKRLFSPGAFLYLLLLLHQQAIIFRYWIAHRDPEKVRQNEKQNVLVFVSVWIFARGKMRFFPNLNIFFIYFLTSQF